MLGRCNVTWGSVRWCQSYECWGKVTVGKKHKSIQWRSFSDVCMYMGYLTVEAFYFLHSSPSDASVLTFHNVILTLQFLPSPLAPELWHSPLSILYWLSGARNVAILSVFFFTGATTLCGSRHPLRFRNGEFFEGRVISPMLDPHLRGPSGMHSPIRSLRFYQHSSVGCWGRQPLRNKVVPKEDPLC